MKVTITCLCGCARQEVTLVAEALPTKACLCHCDTCRSASGMLCTVYLGLASPPTSLASLTNYNSSQRVSRFFCGTCGAHIFAANKSAGEYWVCSGTVEHSRNVVEITHHEWVGNTRDGGLAAFLTRCGQRGLTAYVEDSEQQIMDRVNNYGSEEPKLVEPSDYFMGSTKLQAPPLQHRGNVLAQCHCGGVEYYVTPPSELSRTLSSPWPDLLVPYHSGSPENKQDVKWWMRAENTKFLAGLCACRSCRLAAGFPVQSWAFIPKAEYHKARLNTSRFLIGQSSTV